MITVTIHLNLVKKVSLTEETSVNNHCLDIEQCEQSLSGYWSPSENPKCDDHQPAALIINTGEAAADQRSYHPAPSLHLSFSWMDLTNGSPSTLISPIEQRQFQTRPSLLSCRYGLSLCDVCRRHHFLQRERGFFDWKAGTNRSTTNSHRLIKIR